MFDIKANNVKVDDKLIDTQNRVWTVVAVDDSEQPCCCTSEEVGYTLWFYNKGFCSAVEDYEIVGFAPGYGNQATANKPHKHKDLIIAWANGAEIEFFDPGEDAWTCVENPCWDNAIQYRIKPEPKPDVIKYMGLETSERNGENTWISDVLTEVQNWKHRIKLTFCGETGKLKSAEVIS